MLIVFVFLFSRRHNNHLFFHRSQASSHLSQIINMSFGADNEPWTNIEILTHNPNSNKLSEMHLITACIDSIADATTIIQLILYEWSVFLGLREVGSIPTAMNHYVNTLNTFFIFQLISFRFFWIFLYWKSVDMKYFEKQWMSPGLIELPKGIFFISANVPFMLFSLTTATDVIFMIYSIHI